MNKTTTSIPTKKELLKPPNYSHLVLKPLNTNLKERKPIHKKVVLNKMIQNV